MTRRFIIRPRAERDIQSVYDWYESQEPGLGDEFRKAVRKRLDAIRDFPESCPVICREASQELHSEFITGLRRHIGHARENVVYLLPVYPLFA